MARVLCCLHCRTVLEEIRLAGRRAVVMCVSCDLIGDAREVALGARLVAAGSERGTKRNRPGRVTPAARSARRA